MEKVYCDTAGQKYVDNGWYPAYDCRKGVGEIWFLYVFTG